MILYDVEYETAKVEVIFQAIPIIWKSVSHNWTWISLTFGHMFGQRFHWLNFFVRTSIQIWTIMIFYNVEHETARVKDIFQAIPIIWRSVLQHWTWISQRFGQMFGQRFHWLNFIVRTFIQIWTIMIFYNVECFTSLDVDVSKVRTNVRTAILLA